MGITAIPVAVLFLFLAVRHLARVKAAGGLHVLEILLTFSFLFCLGIGTVIGCGFLALSWVSGTFMLGFVAFIVVCWLYVERYEAHAAAIPARD